MTRVKNLYRIEHEQGPDYVVVRLRDKRPVFYGTRRECAAWLIRNGHDEWR
jgi:hypothetical protein